MCSPLASKFLLPITLVPILAIGLIRQSLAQKPAGDTINSIKSKKKTVSKKSITPPPKKRSTVSRATSKKSAQKPRPSVHVKSAVTLPPKSQESKTALTAVTQENKSKPARAVEPDVMDGLVGWWRCEGNGIDVTGRHPGTAIGSVAEIPGAIGRGLLFDGQSSGIAIEDAEDLKLTSSLTICAWVYISSAPNPGWHRQIFFRGDNRGGLDPYFFCVESNGKLRFEVENAANAQGFVEAEVPFGTFVHTTASLDGSTGQIRIYINGKVAAEDYTNVRPLRDLDPGSKPGLAIGNTQDPSVYSQAFHGIIDEVRLYNRALSPAEVLTVFKRR